MSLLMRSPKATATWTWVVEHDEGLNGLESGCTTAMTVAKALQEHDLLYLDSVDVDWFQYASGHTGFRSRVLHCRGLTTAALANRVRDSRPAGRPEAYPETLFLIGPGNWIAPGGRKRGEPELVGVSVDIAAEDTMVEVSVYHDIWAENDFFGRPHSEVHDGNAPRLSQALRGLAAVLGGEAEAGEPTYFGTAINYGVAAPRGGVADGGLDVTDRL
ncbi:hypothetical protein KGD83_16125 [Nocardiopsis akebiae]|uniref:Uncharacterized protein n=1 Tax=Nocardiopsis akebiae TaxID=2831968 RepID=A0ABX8BXH3_9ACTN|nr:hypothetical protein [Nocardiopsis akebiae]QUX26895.1 hypothetical protein KGD83_16125 [Nocardiopsis akebiae]